MGSEERVELSDDQVRERLSTIIDPCSAGHGRPTDIVSFGLVREVRGGKVPRVVLHLTEPTCMYQLWFMRQVRDAVGPETEVAFVSPDEIWESPAGKAGWASLDLQPMRVGERSNAEE